MGTQEVSLLEIEKQREHIASPLAFQQCMQEHGFTLTQTRPMYTDPDVFRQQWLICPNGAYYPSSTFYRFFGTTSFRQVLRHALSHAPRTRQQLENACPDENLLTRYLRFLQDQEWFSWNGWEFHREPYQGHIANIGRTLEWYVAQWFRVNASSTSLASVRHGVQLAELPLPGDLDVVACLDEHVLVMVECKSSSAVDEAHCLRFLQRVQAFHPAYAILLIDTSAPFSPERLAAFNNALHTLDFSPLIGNRGFYRGAMNIYIVNMEHSIETSLNDVTKYHQWRTSLE